MLSYNESYENLATTMPKAISYMRFSAIHQGKGSTLDRQRKMIDDWLNSNPDIEKSTLSTTDEGVSGYKGDHLEQGFGLIKKAMQDNKIVAGDYLLVEAMDRLGRMEPLKMIEEVTSIVNSGVIIVTLEDNQEYTKQSLNNNASSLYILVGKVQQAHEYSSRLSRRLLAAYDKKKRLARAGDQIKAITPIWIGTDNKLKQPEANMVRACIDRYLKGHGARQLLLDLSDKYPALATVNPSTPKRWFSNRAIIGEWEITGEVIQNVFEPLVDTATFYQLQHEIANRYKNMSPERTYSLSGLVSCTECGKSFHFRRKNYQNKNTGKAYTIIYSNCSRYLQRGRCNNNRTWPYEVLEFIYGQTYGIHLQRFMARDMLQVQSGQIDILKLQLSAKERQINTFLEQVSNFTHMTNVQDRLKVLDEEKNEILKQIRVVENSLETLDLDNNDDLMDDFWSRLNQIADDPIHMRNTLTKLGYRISVGKDSIVVDSLIIPKVETTLTLNKRSQLYGCYVLEAYTPESVILDLDGEHLVQKSKKLYAIGREGLIAESDDLPVSITKQDVDQFLSTLPKA